MIIKSKSIFLMILSSNLVLASFPLAASQLGLSQYGHVALVWIVGLSSSLFVTIAILLKNHFKIPGIKRLYFIFMGSIYLLVSLITFLKLPNVEFLVVFFVYLVVTLGTATLLIVMLKVLFFRYLQKYKTIGNINDHKFWVFSRLLSAVIAVIVSGIYAIIISHSVIFYEMLLVLLVYPLIILVLSKNNFFYHIFQKMKEGNNIQTKI